MNTIKFVALAIISIFQKLIHQLPTLFSRTEADLLFIFNLLNNKADLLEMVKTVY